MLHLASKPASSTPSLKSSAGARKVAQADAEEEEREAELSLGQDQTDENTGINAISARTLTTKGRSLASTSPRASAGSGKAFNLGTSSHRPLIASPEVEAGRTEDDQDEWDQEVPDQGNYGNDDDERLPTFSPSLSPSPKRPSKLPPKQKPSNGLRIVDAPVLHKAPAPRSPSPALSDATDSERRVRRRRQSEDNSDSSREDTTVPEPKRRKGDSKPKAQPKPTMTPSKVKPAASKAQSKKARKPASQPIQEMERFEREGLFVPTLLPNRADLFRLDSQVSNEDDGKRRGTRRRYGPLDYWRGERAVFGRRQSGIAPVPVLQGIMRIPKVENEHKKKRKVVRRTHSQDEEDKPELGWDQQTEKMGVVRDYDTGEEVSRRV